MITYINLLNIFFIYIVIFFFQYVLYCKLIKKKYLLDTEFHKPQAIHKEPTPTFGGILVFSGMFLFFLKNFLSFDYKSFCIFLIIASIFFIGFLDDRNIVKNPYIRFLFLILALIIFFSISNLKIINFDIEIINYINSKSSISFVISIISFFIVINGANLVDGCNGLLLINSIISAFFYGLLAFLFNDIYLLEISIFFILATIFPLCMNIPNAKIFMGDSGAYFCGCILAIVAVELNRHAEISPFLILLILLYFSTETIFSVFRKFFEKKNPFQPDGMHLHIILNKFLLKKKMKNSNFVTTLIISITNFFFIFLGFIFMKNTFILIQICSFYILVYLTMYIFLRLKINN